MISYCTQCAAAICCWSLCIPGLLQQAGSLLLSVPLVLAAWLLVNTSVICVTLRQNSLVTITARAEVSDCQSQKDTIGTTCYTL
jgi:hypothetical protein